MQNIVISLQSATDRRHHIESEFQKHNVDFTFFDALTPDLAKICAVNMQIDNNEQVLSQGELACMMSHITIWQKMINENTPYLAIFEDDIYLGEDAECLLNSSDWINPKWNIIKIETFSKRVFLSSSTDEIIPKKRYITQLKGENLGTAGYILSLQGAQLYLEYLTSNKLLPLDELIFDNFVKHSSEPVYQMIPALCIQEMILNKSSPLLPSALLTDRKNRMHLERKYGVYKLKREVNRVVLQAKRYIFAKEIDFQ